MHGTAAVVVLHGTVAGGEKLAMEEGCSLEKENRGCWLTPWVDQGPSTYRVV